MNTQELAGATILDIVERYTNEEDTRDWAVAWSGGKDSTVTLSLMIKSFDHIPKNKWDLRKVHVVMSDTQVENPILQAYMERQADALKDYVARKGYPVTVNVVKRPVEESYFVLTLGRGYFLPMNNGQGRWCTGRLKIDPQDKALREINPSYILIGTRRGESASRAASIDKWTVKDNVGEHATLTDTHTLMPIVNWTVEDVWDYLTTHDIGWSSTREVRTLYREATGECGVNNPKGLEEKLQLAQAESCGARFGCWLCPVITTDRSTEAMTEYHGWLEPLSDYREMQLKVYGAYKPLRPEGQKRNGRSEVLRKWEAINEKINVITKAGYNRQGKRMKDGQGTFTLEARKYLFEYLMDVQRLVNRLRKFEGLKPMELITDEEIRIIKELWAEDERDYPLLLTNAAGVPFSELESLLDGNIEEEEVEAYKERRATCLKKNKK